MTSPKTPSIPEGEEPPFPAHRLNYSGPIIESSPHPQSSSNLHMPNSSFIEDIYTQIGHLPGNAEEFANMYTACDDPLWEPILAKLHCCLIKGFTDINNRIKAQGEKHLKADDSRNLLSAIRISERVVQFLKNKDNNISWDCYILDIITKCKVFLRESGGSTIPSDFKNIKLFTDRPIFVFGNIICLPEANKRQVEMRLIGEGGYATVHKFKDPFTNITFVIKKAKAGLDEKEIERFKIEYQTLKGLSSPYIVDVYSYNESENSYLMEKMDFSLEKFLGKAPSTSLQARKSIGLQIIKGFNFLHSKGHLHRDISTSNILIKQYEDGTIVAKIADFGLVKTPESNLTTSNTTMKGPWYNDPELLKIGFNCYEMKHELYAIVRLLYFVLTGRSTLGVSHRNETTFNRLCREFVEKGTSSSAEERFPSLLEVKSAFLQIFKDSQESEV